MENNRVLKKPECFIKSPFWDRYIRLIKEEVIPYQWDILNDRRPDAEPSHAIDNLRIAAGEMEGHFYGQVFQDSDVYKWLEAVGNILMLERDPELEKKADEVIDIIEKAQEKDGYLNTYFSIEEPDKRWTNVLECHELYCAGHFIEGAVAYYKATGKEKIYEIACKLADHLSTVFGPEEGKIHGYPGHQEIELALLRLYDLSGRESHLKLAEYFINTRGTNNFFEEEFKKRDRVSFWTKAKIEDPNQHYNQYPYTYYNQFHKPVSKQSTAVGHAVRGVYMYTAMADIARRTENPRLLEACRRLWKNITERQMYITGGIGATPSGEAFTADFDLPNDTNYSETCASIGLIFFAERMLRAENKSVYADVMEQALYNTVLGGMNYDGNQFFYVNPLESVPTVCKINTERCHVKPIRQKWFACACCPPNIARLISGLWEYIYTASEERINVHLYIAGQADVRLQDGYIHIRQETAYPLEGNVRFEVQTDTEKEVTLALRIPRWAKQFTVMLAGEKVLPDTMENGYAIFKRNWKEKTEIQLNLEMKAQFIAANKNIHYDLGRAAIIRGPLVYCLEEADNGSRLDEIILDTSCELQEEMTPDWNGTVVLTARGWRIRVPDTEDLYMPYQSRKDRIQVKAIPYYLWNNRGEGEMQVFTRAE